VYLRASTIEYPELEGEPLLGFTTHKQVFTKTCSALLSFTQLLRIAIQQRQPLLGLTTHKQAFTKTCSALLSFTQLY
jgi:hypothetical protein